MAFFFSVDLHLFFDKVAQLGGYDGCMTKKAWKSIYDDLGGNPQNTSAATCTRRHYEKYVKIPAPPPQNRKRKLVLAAVLLFMSIIVVRFHGIFFFLRRFSTCRNNRLLHPVCS